LPGEIKQLRFGRLGHGDCLVHGAQREFTTRRLLHGLGKRQGLGQWPALETKKAHRLRADELGSQGKKSGKIATSS
jgi:hypothetical protein